MNRETFERLTQRNREVLALLKSAIGPTSQNEVTTITGCNLRSLQNLLDRPPGKEYAAKGPRAKVPPEELRQWLIDNLPERSDQEYAEILRRVAETLDRK